MTKWALSLRFAKVSTLTWKRDRNSSVGQAAGPTCLSLAPVGGNCGEDQILVSISKRWKAFERISFIGSLKIKSKKLKFWLIIENISWGSRPSLFSIQKAEGARLLLGSGFRALGRRTGEQAPAFAAYSRTSPCTQTHTQTGLTSNFRPLPLSQQEMTQNAKPLTAQPPVHLASIKRVLREGDLGSRPPYPRLPPSHLLSKSGHLAVM